MKKEGLTAVIVILIAASLRTGYLSGISQRGAETITSTYISTSTLIHQQTITSTTTSTFTESALFFPGAEAMATDSNGSIGVELVLALNTTTVKQGQDIPNIIEVLNTMPRE